MATYNLTDMKLFVAIADAGNMARGAADCFLAPSSASLRIKHLEAALNTALFIRGARGITLTQAGQVMLEHSRRCLAELQQMHANLAPFASGVQGRITLMASSSAIASHLPEDLGVFLRANPSARISMEERLSEDIVAAVASGRADLGIVTWADRHPDLDFWPYHADEAVVLTPESVTLGQAGKVRFIECLTHPLVSLSSGAAIHTFMAGKAAALNRSMDVRVQVASFPAVVVLVRAGAGIAVIPRSVMRNQPHDGLRLVELDEPWAHRRLEICSRKGDAQLSSFGRALLRQLRSSVDLRG